RRQPLRPFLRQSPSPASRPLPHRLRGCFGGMKEAFQQHRTAALQSRSSNEAKEMFECSEVTGFVGPAAALESRGPAPCVKRKSKMLIRLIILMHRRQMRNPALSLVD